MTTSDIPRLVAFTGRPTDHLAGTKVLTCQDLCARPIWLPHRDNETRSPREEG